MGITTKEKAQRPWKNRNKNNVEWESAGNLWGLANKEKT